jgi:alanine racemase
MTTSLIKSLRPTYALIDLDGLASNIAVAKKLSAADIIAVIKADAYGHGAKEVAWHAYRYCNVRNFAVATISEGFSLHKAFGDSDVRIIVFGYVDSMFYDEVTAHNLLLSIFDHNIASTYHNYLQSKGLTADIVLKIDTGMSRLGFPASLNLAEFAAQYPRFRVSHVMSHLSSSDSDVVYTKAQEERFNDFLAQAHPYSFDTSLFNSSAIAKYHNKFDLVRPGLFMYGYVNGSEAVQAMLKPVMKIFSKVVHVQRLAKGQAVSYNQTFVADKDCVVGVVPIGYADGYNRRLSNKASMYIDGVYCPVRGNVCMDMTIVDLSELGEGAYGKEVEILGEHISATELAGLAGTIEYEFLCGISDRIPRIYSQEE